MRYFVSGGAGFLGVCFGPVVTVNSPASRMAHPSNWEAVLWHEFCHVVTLTKTKNKMPRWLSEGISVYEERISNPTWGQTINPRYRELITKGDMKPIGELSAAYENWWKAVTPMMVNENVPLAKENPFVALYRKQFGSVPEGATKKDAE